ncbi:uncharacterized protein PV09_04228 [Verruconis gallopava]|uniref:Xylanolytic transcriptional activator regulatory domain-containing protein n=1 Tax=Verruconis gallopava TaxID=253628 RepID=A0A0D2AF37_9PEZI|nr:uncharacterized protein PV09_04228 [Verruconis gallopava]KIW05080.1 hypothetical protein PV09_04228 [Verruconis gallopava]
MAFINISTVYRSRWNFNAVDVSEPALARSSESNRWQSSPKSEHRVSKRRPPANMAQAGSENVESPGSLDDDTLSALLKERSALRSQIAQLEVALALSKPSASHEARTVEDSSQPEFEELVPALEQFDLDPKFDSNANPVLQQLWTPGNDPLYMLLPTRSASRTLVEFALTTFGWLHCAVRADCFLEQHENFWNHLEAGHTVEEEQRPWLSLWLSLLSVGLMYISADDIPDQTDLPRDIISEPADKIAYAVDVSRMWYESALQELHRSSFLRKPTIESIQTILVLTLCNSNNGEHQQEWVLLGACINMARSLDMHRLGSEQSFSNDLSTRPVWATPANRELGRRMWWNLVICDWLGPWSRPPSISPASFCCSISGNGRFDHEVLPSSSSGGTSSSPSPVQYLTVMARLAYIFYIYFKANATRTAMKTTKALDEIDAVRRSLPLHLSPHFPANSDDFEWEKQHPWVTFQRYQISVVIDFMVLATARSLAIARHIEDKQKYRTIATAAARRLLLSFTGTAPRFFKLLWSSSASAVAAGIFLTLDYLISQSMNEPKSAQYLNELLALIQSAISIMRQNSVVTVHAENGVTILLELCNICQQWPQTPLGTESLSLQSLLSYVKNKARDEPGPDLSHASFVLTDMLSPWPSGSEEHFGSSQGFRLGFDFDSQVSMYSTDSMLNTGEF